MIATWLVVAQAKLPQGPRVWDPRLLWTTLALAAIIVLGAIAVAVLDRWRKRSVPADFDPNDQLAQFRELYEKGELSQAEFNKIRERLTEKIREEMNVPPPEPPETVTKEVASDEKPAAPAANGTKVDPGAARENPPITGS